jgi:putative membrane protein
MMVRLLLSWLVNAVALMALPLLVPGVSVESLYAALLVALVLGLVNTLVRPVLVLLTLPVTLVTLGLFLLVINGLLFWFVASFVKGFAVTGFWTAVLGALAYSVISTLLAWLLVPSRRG